MSSDHVRTTVLAWLATVWTATPIYSAYSRPPGGRPPANVGSHLDVEFHGLRDDTVAISQPSGPKDRLEAGSVVIYYLIAHGADVKAAMGEFDALRDALVSARIGDVDVDAQSPPTEPVDDGDYQVTVAVVRYQRYFVR